MAWVRGGWFKTSAVVADFEHDLAEMGRRARAFAEAESDRSIAVSRYEAVLEELRGRRR
jgi:hypothetical protein